MTDNEREARVQQRAREIGDRPAFPVYDPGEAGSTSWHGMTYRQWLYGTMEDSRDVKGTLLALARAELDAEPEASEPETPTPSDADLLLWALRRGQQGGFDPYVVMSNAGTAYVMYDFEPRDGGHERVYVASWSADSPMPAKARQTILAACPDAVTRRDAPSDHRTES